MKEMRGETKGDILPRGVSAVRGNRGISDLWFNRFRVSDRLCLTYYWLK